ncbi:MAG: hypothetical protein R2693_11985 [Nocardioidaceae bacterium]
MAPAPAVRLSIRFDRLLAFVFQPPPARYTSKYDEQRRCAHQG